MRVLFSKVGKVSLVGAGPGDPGLLTRRGAQCLEEADVVVYDRLIDLRLLDLTSASAERIAVGKKGGHYGFSQEKIHVLLEGRAREGKRVVRLKGGDPFLFGRGGEEALYLAKKNIPFEIVPGVTSAFAVPASAGIPVTHRTLSSSIAIVTGHQACDPSHPIRWDQLATATDTLIVLMPLQNLRPIVSQLVLHGRSLETPAALIQSGSLETQRKVMGTLRTIVSRGSQAHMKSPSLLVVGEVVQLSGVLDSLKDLEPSRDIRQQSSVI